MRTRTIPSSGERIPVIGLGTWQTFDVGPEAAQRAGPAAVLRCFCSRGGRVIDSSPMYGRAETVVGDLVADGAHEAFLATKVWTNGRDAGERQIRESMRRLRCSRLDLLQIHNLVDWRAHLPTLRALRDAGAVRYLGVTHYAPSAFGELEQLLRTEALDFVQLPYSATARGAERRLLPAAADTGTAVLVMRPFEEGALLDRVRGRALPGWAVERGFSSWPQLLLAFVLAHPAVTCALPATTRADHAEQNLAAGNGPALDQASCAQLHAALAE